MENLSIAQHSNTLHCARICDGTYQLQLRIISRGFYVYLQCEGPITLVVKAGRIILLVKEVLPSGLCFWKTMIVGNVTRISKIVLHVI